MNTLAHLALAFGALYLVVCAAWWVIFWWDATDAEQEAKDMLRLERLAPATLAYRQDAFRRATYARAQMARFYLAPWLILTGQARRNPPRHRQ